MVDLDDDKYNNIFYLDWLKQCWEYIRISDEIVKDGKTKAVNENDKNEILEITRIYEQGIYEATRQGEIEEKKQSLGIYVLQQQLDQIEKENASQNTKEQLMTSIMARLEPRLKELAIFEAEIEQKIDKNRVKQITDEYDRSLKELSGRQSDKTTDLNHMVQIRILENKTTAEFARVSHGNERA